MEGVTRESMRPLLDLQRVDSGIDRLEARRADLPEQREHDELAARRDELAATTAEQRAALDGAIREQTKIEGDIGLIDEKLKRETERLYSGEISNAKELASIQAELDALRRRKSHLEDQELEVMERREEIEKGTGEVGAQLTELDHQVTDAAARRDAATVEIDRELGELRAERERLLPLLHAEVLELYEDQRARKGGVAVGALEKWVCSACHLPLSPMAKEEIRTSDEPIIRCENCRRILVLV